MAGRIKGKRGDLAACAALAVMTAAVFWPVLGHGFINFDDNSYVSQNRYVLSGLTAESVLAAFSETYNGHWHPLTMLSYALDTTLHGRGPSGYHFTNLLLHVANTALLFFALRELTGAAGRSFVVAALFAVHPLHVEPVAWIAGRKDVLSTLFFVLSILAYASWTRKPALGKYALLVLWLLLGLLSKAMLVTLPAVLLLLDLWPLKRIETGRLGHFWRSFGQRLLEKTPLFLIVAAFAAVTVFTQAGAGTMTSYHDLPLGTRLANAIESYVTYLVLTFAPVGLAPFYPHSGRIDSYTFVAINTIVLAVISLAAPALWCRAPYILVGWFWFLGTLLPVSGLMQAGIQAYADRYTYVPLIGVFIALVWGLADLARRSSLPRYAAPAAAAVIVLGCSVASYGQVRLWKDDVTLFEHTVRVTRDNYVAHMILGNAYYERGRTDEAVAQYERALEIEPHDADTHVALGIALSARGDAAGAIAHYETAIVLNDRHALAEANFGAVLARLGRGDEAAAHYLRALEIDPEHPVALNGLAHLHAERGESAEARTLFERGVTANPFDAKLWRGYGLFLAKSGDRTAAIEAFQTALGLDWMDADTHNNLAVVLLETGDVAGAVRHFETALELDPNHATARGNLERARAN